MSHEGGGEGGGHGLLAPDLEQAACVAMAKLLNCNANYPITNQPKLITPLVANSHGTVARCVCTVATEGRVDERIGLPEKAAMDCGQDAYSVSGPTRATQ